MKFNHKVIGKGPKIIMLHGWAKSASLESFDELQRNLAKKGFEVWTIDLPGFGKTPKAPDSWGTEDFAREIATFIEETVLANNPKSSQSITDKNKFYLLGHSFGGSLTAYIAAHLEPKPEKIILCASAGLRYKTLKAKLLLPFAKAFKLLRRILPEDLYQNARKNIYYYFIGERDYVDTADKKEQFVRITNTDLTETFKKIKTPTLIIWGKDDKITPLSMGEKINELITGSEIKIIEGKHGIPITKAKEVAALTAEFLKN